VEGAVQAAEQGRRAGSTPADDTDDLARTDRERDVLQGDVAIRKDLAQALHDDHAVILDDFWADNWDGASVWQWSARLARTIGRHHDEHRNGRCLTAR